MMNSRSVKYIYFLLPAWISIYRRKKEDHSKRVYARKNDKTPLYNKPERGKQESRSIELFSLLWHSMKTNFLKDSIPYLPDANRK